METQAMEKCKNADRYTGKSFPRCNGGKPCKACLLKYAIIHSGMRQEHAPVEAPRPACACGYDQRITGAFDQVATTDGEGGPTRQQVLQSMGHTRAFPNMINAMFQDDAGEAHYYILADAVRYGMAVGRRLQSLEFLEEMVGYKEDHPEIVVEPFPAEAQ